MKKTGLIVLICLFAISCSENPVSIEDVGGKNDTDGIFPMDAFVDGNTLFALYTDLGDVRTAFIGVYEQNGEWELKERIYSDLPDGLRFSHTIVPTPEGFLISDSANSRILKLSPTGQKTWNSDESTIRMDYPNDAELSPDGDYILICDNSRGNQRVIEISLDGTIQWEHPVDEEVHDVDYCENGNIRFVRSLSKAVEEVDRNHERTWYHQIDDTWPRCSEKLSDGSTLIAGESTIYRVTENHEESVITTGLEGLYNIHHTDEGILTCTWQGVLMLDDNGSILWSVGVPDDDISNMLINPDQLRMTMPFEEWKNLMTIGYIQ